MRPVTVLATGGTIAMRGEQAIPASDARDLVGEALPGGAPPELELRDLMNRPGPQITLEDALSIARAAWKCADGGRGVVVTCGTDTMEELALLTDLGHDASAPIVFTGANRPGSHPGADGAANLADAIAVAADEAIAGVGAVVVFGGEIHAAHAVTKVDTTGPAAFGSPQCGPFGRVVGGVPWLAARPRRPLAVVRPERLDGRVEIVSAFLGADGAALQRSADAADGVVAAVLGAGHVPPAFLSSLRVVAARLPVVIVSRVARGGMLLGTYGFEGSERDVRDSGAIAAGMLTAAAARIKLLACMGAGLDRASVAAAFAGDDVARA